MSLNLSCRRPFLTLALASLAACSSADQGNEPGGGGSGAAGAGASATAGAGSSSAGGAMGGSHQAGAASAGTAGNAAMQAGAATGGASGGSTGSAGSAQGGTGGSGLGGGAQAGMAAVAGSAGTGGGSTGVAGKLIGFATQNGGTTGGAAGQTVRATTFAELKMYAESATAYVIEISGTISNGANGGKISIKSNKSLIGVGNNTLLNGVGLEVASSNNVIIQNLRITLMGVTTRTDTAGVYSTADGAILVNGGDAISISGTSKNVWVDHCELYSEDPAVQTNKDLYDGLIDIKGQTGFITISWCYLHDHHKGGLVGAADDDLFADRKVTLHHNYYDKVRLRVPMYRGSTGHFFNNYVVGATDASEIRADTCVRVEKNYYEALHYSIYTPADAPGKTERIDNIEVSRTERAYPAACTASIPYAYESALTNATADVKTLVPAQAGVGKL